PLAWLSLAAVPVAAQNIYPYMAPRYGPGWQTPLSPYLNLLLPGNTAVNYYDLVQPQFQARQFYNQTTLTIQGIVNQLPPPPGFVTSPDLDAPMPATGHPTAFSYTGSYFKSTMTGQPMVSIQPQRRMGQGTGMMGPGGRPMGMGGLGAGGGAGVWPNMRTGMGTPGR